MKSPFLVDITPLRKQPGSAIHVERAGRLPGLGITAVEVPADAEVQVEAHLAWAQEDVVVTATCGRRGSPRAGGAWNRPPVRSSLGFARSTSPGSNEEETYRLEGTEVDLAPLVRDAVLLHLPPAPLCSEDCRGLCTRCGANLNEAECGCEPGPSDPRWAALDVLKDLN